MPGPNLNKTPAQRRQQPQRMPRRAAPRRGVQVPADPLAVLTPAQIRAAAAADINATYQPALRDLLNQQRQTTSSGQQLAQTLSSAYAQAGQMGNDAYARQQAITRSLGDQLRSIGNESNQAQQDAAQQAQQHYSSLGGLGQVAQPQLSRALAEAQMGNAANVQTARSSGAVQGANQQGLLNTLVGTIGLSGARAQSSLADQTQALLQGIGQRRGSLLQNRQNATTQEIQRLREYESSKALSIRTLLGNEAYKQGQLTNAAARIQSSNANAAAARRLTARGQDLAHTDRQANQQAARDRSNLSVAQFVARYGITPGQLAQLPNPGQWLRQHAPAYQSKTGSGRGGKNARGGGLTGYQVSRYYGGIRDIPTRYRILATTPIPDGKGGTRRATPQDITNRLAREYPLWLIRAAEEYHRLGYFSPATARLLRQQGLPRPSHKGFRTAPPRAHRHKGLRHPA